MKPTTLPDWCNGGACAWAWHAIEVEWLHHPLPLCLATLLPPPSDDAKCRSSHCTTRTVGWHTHFGTCRQRRSCPCWLSTGAACVHSSLSERGSHLYTRRSINNNLVKGIKIHNSVNWHKTINTPCSEISSNNLQRWFTNVRKIS